MKNLITKCDVFGFKPCLHVNKEKSFQTLITGVISIVMGFLSIATTLYFGSELVFKTTSTVIKTTDSISSFGPYTFSNIHYNVLVGLQNQNFQYWVDPTVFTVSGSMTVIRNVKSEVTGKIEQQFSLFPIKVELCENFYKDSDMIEKNMVFPLNKYYCPEPGKASMEGYWGAEVFRTFRINFNKCVNTTENQNHCKPQEIIDKEVQGAYVAYEMTSYKVDQRDYKSPLKRLFADDFNIINSKLSIEYVIGYMPLVFHSNDGLVLNEDNKYEGLDYHEKIFYKLNDGKDSFVSFTFEGFPFSTIYLRSYIKLQTVITQIGGFLKAITIVASLISSLFSENYYFFYYFASVFPEEKKNSEYVRTKGLYNTVASSTKVNDLVPKNENDLSYSPRKNGNQNNQKKVTFNEIDEKSNFSLNKKQFKQKSLKHYVDSPKKINSRLFDYICGKICFWKKKTISTKINQGMLSIYRQKTSIDKFILNSFRIEELTYQLNMSDKEIDEKFHIWLEDKIRVILKK